MKVLRRIIDSINGFQIICETYNDEPDTLLQTVATFIHCLGHGGRLSSNTVVSKKHTYSNRYLPNASSIPDQFFCLSQTTNKVCQCNFFAHLSYSLEINLAAMKYFGKLLIISQSNNYKFTTFAEQINELYLTPQLKDSLKPGLFEFEIQSQSLFDWFDMNNESPRFEWMAITVVYRQLSDLFTHFGEKMTVDNHAYEYTCQTIEALLKCAPSVRKLANDDNFLLCICDHIMQILDMVHGSFSDYIRQYGNAKVKWFVFFITLLENISESLFSSFNVGAKIFEQFEAAFEYDPKLVQLRMYVKRRMY